MMIGGYAGSPDEVFGRFMANQQAKEQFSENINHVVHGRGSGLRSHSANRQHSPGLKAGAALALAPHSQDAAREAYTQSAAARAAIRANAHRSTNPFDDHSAFREGGSFAPQGPAVLGPPAGHGLLSLGHDAQQAAYQDARSSGNRNRAAGHAYGDAAPFDAPERPNFTSAMSAAMSSEEASRSQAFAEARTAALRNRMGGRAGADSLISGNYLLADTAPAGQREPLGGGKRRIGSLPPRPEVGDVLLPQTVMKVQFDGGSLSTLTREKAAYLNSMVSAEANRTRQTNCAISLG